MGRVFDPQKDSWSQALEAEAFLLEKKGSQAAACFSEPQKALLPILAHALALRESGREEDLNSFLGSLPRLPGGLDECLRWELSQRLRDEKFFQKLPKNRRPSWAKRLRNWFLRK
jgi:hypothetical protein